MAELEDTAPEAETASVGERLRSAREAKGLTLEEIASETRIPRRHLESLEAGEWDRLPAPTYSIGFAKSYASTVGLDRNEIGDQLRSEMGGQRPETTTSEVYQAADPARTMPRWLVIGAVVAILLLVLVMSWLSRQSLQGGETASIDAATEVPAQVQAPPPAAPPTPPADAPVVLAAGEPVWIQVRERGGRTLFEGILAAGQRYQVPQGAEQPVLRTGKPEALQITVGTVQAPSVGPPATTVSNVSLRGPDLLGRSNDEQVTVPAPSAPPGVQNTAG